MRKLSFIIVNYNGFDFLEGLVKSLKKIRHENKGVLIDNNAKKPSPEWEAIFYFRYYPLRISFKDLNEHANTGKEFACRINRIEVLKSVSGGSEEVNCQPDLKEGSDALNNLLQRSIKYMEGSAALGKNESGNFIYGLRRDSLIALPVPDDDSGIRVTMDIFELIPGHEIIISADNKIIFSKKIENNHEILKFDIGSENILLAKNVINSEGSMINSRFYAKEIGYEKFESKTDKKEFEAAEQASDAPEVFALPGTSFLCRKSMLEKIGFFDETFFTYYEDMDFFWRSRLCAYRNYVCNSSIVRHLHCGSGAEWSYSFTYHVLRNRLLMIYKCAWFGAFVKNYLSFSASAVINYAYMAASKIKRKPLDRIDIPIRIRIVFEFFILFFLKLPERIKIRKRALSSDNEIIKWFNDF